MKVTEAERLQQLESAIEQRQQEIERLAARKDELQSAVQVATPEYRADPLLASFPVLDYCGRRARKSVKAVRVEQVGNVMAQMDIARKAISEQNRLDAAEAQAVRRRLLNLEKTTRAREAALKKMTDDAGIDPKQLSSKARGAAARDTEFEGEASVAELEARMKLVRKEITAARLVADKKGETIKEMRVLVEGRAALIDEIDDLYNQIRVVDRDTRVETEELQRLLDDDAEAAELLQEKRSQRLAARGLIDQDTADIRAERADAAAEQRVPAERVIKAQDYRLEQLGRRLKAVDAALENNGLTRSVERILARTWQGNRIEAPADGDGDDLYDIERIIPAQETIHPGLYNMFLTERDRTTRTVSVLNIGAKEKEEVVASLACRVDTLARECNLAIQELDELASGAAFAEEEERNRALQQVKQQRARYDELAAEKQRLRSELAQA